MANDASYYRAQAARARAEAGEATLDNVRERAMRSVSAFEAMATQLERVTRMRLAREKGASDAGDDALVDVEEAALAD